MKIGCIIQARMASTRLPGKVLRILDYNESTTILGEIVNRLLTVSNIDDVIVATTTNPEDDSIVEFCKSVGVKHFRGDENNVLNRYYEAAKKNELTDVIRMTSDNPFVDVKLIEDMVDYYKSTGCDYLSCGGPNKNVPIGIGCEIFSFESLKKTQNVAKDSFYTEHVTSYIYTHEDEFDVQYYTYDSDINYSELRLTVDTKQDYILACVLKEMIQTTSFIEIVDLMEHKPYLKMINEDIIQKQQYKNEKEELSAAVKLLELQELHTAAKKLNQLI